jgi:hypothetical protein
MPGHGDHWETLYSAEDYVKSKISRDIQEGLFVGRADCVDVEGGTDRTEQVMCLRWGTDHLANQMLVVSNSAKQSNFLFSGYPVVLDGTPTEVTVSKVEPWEYGIEGWVHCSVAREGASICFFDTMYFAGTAVLKEGDVVSYQLAGLAYMLRPIQTRSFEIAEGPLWDLEKQRRLDAGESLEEASRPVEVHRTGAAVFLPRSFDGDDRDDAEFQGVIEGIDTFEHDGQKVYRLEMVLMRLGDEALRMPVYASERALDGYVPRLGEDVEGVMWVQGRRIEADADLNPQHPGQH